MSLRLPHFLTFFAFSTLLPGLRAEDATATFESKILPVLESRCTKCHGEKRQKAEVRLDALKLDPHLWYRVLDQLEFGEMPPEDAAELSDSDRANLIEWIRGELTDKLAEKRQIEGRATIRRLTRAEYSNTIEDLFGVRINVSELPEDARVEGFTKVSTALPMSTDGAYGYYRAARELLEKWILVNEPKPETQTLEARTHRLAACESGQSPGHTLVLPDGWYVSFNTNDTSGRLIHGKGGRMGPDNRFSSARIPGMHKLKAHIYAYQSEKPLMVGIYTGHTAAYPQIIDLVGLIEAPPGEPALIETEIYLGNHHSGANRIRLIPFGLGEQVPKNSQASKCKGPGLAMQYVEVTTPKLPVRGFAWLTEDLSPELRTELIRYKSQARHNPKLKADISRYKSTTREDFLATLRQTLQRILPRLFRRDPRPGEINAFLSEAAARIDAGDLIHEVWLDAISAALTAPDFLCVIEKPGELDDFALASRLAYFLWNSAPDERLLGLAREAKLRDPDTLRKQTDRLLDDPRSARFVTDFLDQWLELHAINDTTPNGRLYPEYGDDLKFSSLLETRGTFARILAENRSVREFAAPGWVLANGRLAEHYGLPDVHGGQLRPVPLPANSRWGGFWTQPAILKVTADGTSTSPVKRGVWMARRLLGAYISPPPPNIEPITPDISGAKTVRQQIELHSSEGSCAGCHQKFDPYGLALESFDVMGQFRTSYRVFDPEVAKLPWHKRKNRRQWMDGLPVDASGVTPDGVTFEGLAGLRDWLAVQPEKLAWGVTWNLVTYATGEPSGPLDRRAVQEIVDSAKSDGYGLRSLLHRVVQSQVFRSK